VTGRDTVTRKKTEAGGIIFYIKDRITISNPHTNVLSEDKENAGHMEITTHIPHTLS
jgi:hypothetical protein